MNVVVAEPVRLNNPVDVQDAKEQMIEIATKKYKNIEPIKDKDSLEDCFTEEYGKLYFWFNVPMGTKHGIMGATKTLSFDLKYLEELVPACCVTGIVKKLHEENGVKMFKNISKSSLACIKEELTILGHVDLADIL